MNTRTQADKILRSVKSSGIHYRDSLPMIASENIISPLVATAVNSDLHGRYAEGLPGKRYYQGCDDFDSIESIGIESAKRVFNCNFTNIQSTSGTVSNIASLKALAKPEILSQQCQPLMEGIYRMQEWVRMELEDLTL